MERKYFVHPTAIVDEPADLGKERRFGTSATSCRARRSETIASWDRTFLWPPAPSWETESKSRTTYLSSQGDAGR